MIKDKANLVKNDIILGVALPFLAGAILLFIKLLHMLEAHELLSSIPFHAQVINTPSSSFVGIVLFTTSSAMIICIFRKWVKAHGLDKNGLKYALLHERTLKKARKALLESGYYFKSIYRSKEVALLPTVILELSPNLKKGLLKIENHPKYNNSYEAYNMSSSLGEFVVEMSYLSADENWYLYELSNSKFEEQELIKSFEDYKRLVENVHDYELLIDSSNIVRCTHLLCVSPTGGGKTYLLYHLLLQIQIKSLNYHMYLCDPKGSSLLVVGEITTPSTTAGTVEEIIKLIDVFHQKMQERKVITKELLKSKLDSDYSDFGEEPHILVIDEYSSLIEYIGTLEKKRRDVISHQIGDIVRMGRQVGCFLWVFLQKSCATTISTALRDSMICTLVLGAAPRTTYQTAMGVDVLADIPNRKYAPGTGLYTYQGKTIKPTRVFVPTMDFDILQSFKAIIDDG